MEEQVNKLEERIQELEALIKAQAQLIEKLQTQLAGTSSNSHRPPSSDPPKTRSQRRRRKSGRKPGGQKGHKPSKRQMVEPDKLDHIVDCLPTACKSCQRALHGVDEQPRLHQVWQLPPIAVEVTQY